MASQDGKAVKSGKAGGGLSAPPPALKKPMTREGFKRLAAEHDELLLVERPKVVLGIQIAAAEGDRSENAEYIYGRKRLRELDKRLRYLGGLLKDVQIVDPDKLGGDRVTFGSTVYVRDETGEEKEYTIVGEGESDHRQGSISWQAPVARALLGKRIGDVILVHRPAGEIELEILALRFGDGPKVLSSL
jgi:transcription elongation factor GreB